METMKYKFLNKITEKYVGTISINKNENKQS